jgi:para-nitrobenzyl esterase
LGLDNMVRRLHHRPRRTRGWKNASTSRTDEENNMTDPTEVTLTAGTIRGRQLGGGVAFRGIPYAAPPIGALRFRAPQTANPWSGVRDATKWGSMAVQIPGPGMQSLGFGGDPSQDPTWGGAPGPNEDCLFINVTTPNRLSAGPEGQAERGAPVLVWIHGGGYVSGSGADVGDGLSFVRDHGIMFVSFNYRLGPLGFLHLAPLLDDPGQQQHYRHAGNVGLLDQIAALG